MSFGSSLSESRPFPTLQASCRVSWLIVLLWTHSSLHEAASWPPEQTQTMPVLLLHHMLFMLITYNRNYTFKLTKGVETTISLRLKWGLSLTNMTLHIMNIFCENMWRRYNTSCDLWALHSWWSWSLPQTRHQWGTGISEHRCWPAHWWSWFWTWPARSWRWRPTWQWLE